ncbi:MAG TPA: metalloregulator ArsR/SmtB family transcription factor [Candidatus Limnocylindria bacterium]|nr:metalloregulator ArsR/SmtB family transcription factor [Candidatus Limnocylindria bacterium]
MDKRYSCLTTQVHEDAVREVREQMDGAAALDGAAQFFKVMGDPTRLRILHALDRRELCVCDIASLLGMTVSAVSHQLARLRRASLVRSRREGKNIFYDIDDEHVRMMLRSGVEHAREDGEAAPGKA